MAAKTASERLCRFMCRKGYPEDFSALVARELHTDFTAGKMMAYLSHFDRLPMEEVADEMLSILALRDSIVERKVGEHAQHQINRLYRYGFDGEET